MRRAVLWSVGVAVGSLWLVAPAPSYDPWAWLLWGRELAHGTLTTSEGPAFKPLPVLVDVLLTPLGGLGPEVWVVLARAGAALAVVLAYRAGRELGGSRVAALLAAAGLVGTAGFLANAAEGLSEGLLLGLALAAWTLLRSGRRRAAVVAAIGSALLRVETWPFLLAWAGLDAARRRSMRPAVLVVAVLVPAAWFVPEWAGSGQLLRSASRARVPNPGQPALADVPALASLREAVALPPWPTWAGVVALVVMALVTWRRAARVRSSNEDLTMPDGGAADNPMPLSASDDCSAWVTVEGEPRLAAADGGGGRVVIEREAQAVAASEPQTRLATENRAPLAAGRRPPPLADDGSPSATAVQRTAPWRERRLAELLAWTSGATLLAASAVGMAWMAIVAAMAQVGFSGEPRYAMPGAALLAASGGAGLAVAGSHIVARPVRAGSAGPDFEGGPPAASSVRRSWRAGAGRWAAAGVGAIALALAFVVTQQVDDARLIRAGQAYQRRLQTDLPRAIAAAGGRDAVVACGTPYVGRLRGPLFAYHLRLPKPAVEPDDPPTSPGMVFRSALHERAPATPDAPAVFTPRAGAGTWQVLASCGPGPGPPPVAGR